jgi:hypothetical protein
MISFPCPCKAHTFSVPDSEAGGLIQCPRCGRLNDIPTLDDLRSLNPDGTLKLGDAAKPAKSALKDLQRTYDKSRTNEAGDEYDLRQSVDDLRKVGAKEKGIAGDVKPEKPKYDPITGELVRPLDIKPEPNRPAGASGKTGGKGTVIGAVGTSAAADAMDRQRRKEDYDRASSELFPIPSLASLPFRLLEPINLLMMIFTAVALMAFSLFSMPVLAGLIFAIPVPIVVGGVLLAHYANCVEDLGPGEENDIPRFLRDAEFLADIWKPFVRMVFSLGVCFAPPIVFASRGDGFIQFVGTGVLAVLGAMMFPAVALVFCASQHVGNLRPDRLLGTIVVLGWQYVPTMILALLAVVLHVATMVILVAASASLFGTNKSAIGQWWLAAAITTPLAVYFGHLAAWWLGVTYRRHQGQFPWVFEMHERARAEHKRLKVLAEIEKSRRKGSVTP